VSLVPGCDSGAQLQRNSKKLGVLLMAYGSPDTLDDVEAYYTHIRGGRRPSPGLIEGLKERYALVGGKTPLSANSEATRQKLEERLNGDKPGESAVKPAREAIRRVFGV